MALYGNSVQLIRLCYISDPLTWLEARQRCVSINYRLFEINTYLKELSFFNYFKSFAINQEFHWVNGIAEDSPIATDWYVYDPHRVWNYTSTAWFPLVKAPVPGFCLGVIYTINGAKFTEKDCDNFQSTFWCEY